MRVLLLEDEAEIGQWITRGLTEAGHVVDHLADGAEALTAASSRDYDLIVLDRMTPTLDGLSVLRGIRAIGKTTPAMFLTALGAVEDRVEGLEVGADDYLAKPFAMSEFLARANALMRRAQMGDGQAELSVLTVGPLELDLIRRNCRRNGQAIELNTKEFNLLEIMMRNKGRVVTRTMLLEQIWNLNFDPMTNVVETHMSRLRAKIEKPFGDTLIRTLRGSGYVLDD
ncbi:response regulator transcription factor [Rhodobacteraceae bacterium B1Z28]|uniref:Response regulator transcription factor n=1 Tax=Ruegeria haliotis TaxID=2747601 RepID=A0ABX2PWF0_9RHOB|nr:response regulator transcription factor [Ruegeria haliotis]NVO57437.1 response regulator transcription factor [Ruegeria haliotis]